jgi:hypothetical protein
MTAAIAVSCVLALGFPALCATAAAYGACLGLRRLRARRTP